MTYQTSLTGDDQYVGHDIAEARTIIRDFPYAASDRGLFFFLALKRRCKWVAQLEDAKQSELRAFCRDWESLRRRAQEAISEVGA